MDVEVNGHKIVIYGHSGVGKNCLKYRLITGDYLPEYDPYWGEDWLAYDLQVDGRTEKVQIRRVNPPDADLGSINAINNTYLKEADGIILAYSFKDRNSYEVLQTLKDHIAGIRGMDDFPIVIIETKVDLDPNGKTKRFSIRLIDINISAREIHPDEIKELAAKWGTTYFSLSSKENKGVIEPFQQLVRQIEKFRVKSQQKDAERKLKEDEELKKAKNAKSEIPPSTITLEPLESSFVANMATLFNNQNFSDLTLIVQQKPLYLHKIILFARQPDLKNQIKKEEKIIDLGDSLSYLAAETAFKYLYTGIFQEKCEDFDGGCKKLLEKFDIAYLRPILKQEPLPRIAIKFDRSAMKDTSDVTIVIKEKKQQREISCHMVILCARSEYFRTMHQESFKEMQTKIIEVDDCSYEAFLTLIEYFYTDEISIADPVVVCDLLKLAHRYNDKAVLNYVERYFLRRMTVKNVSYMYLCCDLFSLDPRLKQACEEFISYRYAKVSKTASFKLLDKKTQKYMEESQKVPFGRKWKIPPENNEDLLLKAFKSFTMK